MICKKCGKDMTPYKGLGRYRAISLDSKNVCYKCPACDNSHSLWLEFGLGIVVLTWVVFVLYLVVT